MVGLTTEMMSNNKFKPATLRAWESGKHAGLTESSAEHVVNRLAEFGVNCTLEWLLFGMGEAPSHIGLIGERAKLLENDYPNLIGTSILDESMSPIYNEGDRVLATPVEVAPNKSYLNQDFLITQKHTGKDIVRTLASFKDSSVEVKDASNTKEQIPLDDIKKWGIVSIRLVYIPPMEQINDR